YLDESQTPPRWRCEDECIEENSEEKFCGTTSHFTNFALLLMTNSRGESPCSSYWDWILDGFWEDFSLILACIVAILFCGVVVILIFSTEKGRKVLTGRETLHAMMKQVEESTVMMNQHH